MEDTGQTLGVSAARPQPRGACHLTACLEVSGAWNRAFWLMCTMWFLCTYLFGWGLSYSMWNLVP